MPDQLEETLRDATADLRVRWESPHELRRRATRRRRRLFAFAALLSALALAAAGRFAVVNLAAGPTLPPECSNVDPQLPDSEADIVVAVYDATLRDGVAEGVAVELRGYRFQVAVVTQSHVLLGDDAVAAVRYGPSEVGKAHIVRAYLRDAAVAEFDASRDDGVVDVFLGPKFERLATPDEMRGWVAQKGAPEMPC